MEVTVILFYRIGKLRVAYFFLRKTSTQKTNIENILPEGDTVYNGLCKLYTHFDQYLLNIYYFYYVVG